jgi:rSAM/selenodomain-associated transferase 1
MAEHVVQAVQHPGWTTLLYVDHPDGVVPVREWLGLPTHLQHGADLGERLQNAVADHSNARVVVIGTDAPDVDASVVASAFSALDNHHLVLGPAYDGGYYLIGLQCPLPDVFKGIEWSTERVLSQTVQAAVNSNATVHIMQPLRDIDTEDDVRLYITEQPNNPLRSVFDTVLSVHRS